MTAIVKCSQNFIATEVDDEIVIVSLDSGELFSLKDSAREIWTLIDDQRSASEILDMVAAAYGVPRERVDQEGRAFLEQIADAGLIERNPE